MAEKPKALSATTQGGGGAGSMFSLLVMIGSILVCELIFHFVFGSRSNFVDGCDPSDNSCHPLEHGLAGVFGLVYKGGFVIPISMGVFLMLVVFSIERFLTLNKAQGTASLDTFVHKVQLHLNSNNVDAALTECDRQQGSVGNVVKEVLTKYKSVQKEENMDKEQRKLAIQKALEETVALEIPMLQKHMIIIATIVSLGTLLGLIGTVLGMIRAFAALGGGGGAPDAAALAVGISEALINTALGITTSTFATISYNYFNSVIDGMTYRMDEAGFSIIQTYGEKH
jgi:biopolymer transport protein ExbB